MKLISRLFAARKPSTSGAQPLPLRWAKQQRLASRSQNGTVVIDLRKADPETVASGSVFNAMVKQDLAHVNGPLGLRVWVLPGTALAAWSNRPDTFAEILTDFIGVASDGAPDVTVIAGPYKDASGVLPLMQSLGHQVVFIGANEAPPVVEVRLSNGEVVTGMRPSLAAA